MFGKNAAKKAEQQAAQQQQLANQQIATSQKPTPVQEFLDSENLGFLQQTTRPDFDITKVDALRPQLAQFAYDTAEENQNNERMGKGLLTMGGSGNEGLSSLIRQNRADRRRQAAGGNLARAFAAKDASVRGSALPLISLTQNRNLGLSSLLSNSALNQAQRADQLRSQSGFLRSPLFNALQQARF